MKVNPCLFAVIGLLLSGAAASAQTNVAALPLAASTNLSVTNASAEVQVAAVPTTPLPVSSGAEATLAASESSSTNGGIIPFIDMEEVALTDAIKNLARQAGLNYMLDPKVTFGQVGADGKQIPQPSLTVRWENVTAQQALLALLANYDLQLVEDAKSRISRVTLRDPKAPDPLITKIIQLKFSGATNIISTIQSALKDPRAKVVADMRTSQLLVVTTEKEMPEIEQMIAQLDTKTKQVLIEARLLETSINPSTSKGIDWSGTLAGQNVTFGNGIMSGKSTTTSPGAPSSTTVGQRTVTTTPSSSTLTVLESIIGNGGLGASTMQGFTPQTFFLNADGVHAVVSFLNKYAEAKVISTPRTVTLDNEPARIEVVRASPIINVTAGTANTTGGSQIQYTNLGVILNVTPRISANNYVNLKVEPEVSRVFDTVSKNLGVQGVYQADEYDIRKLSTRVMVPSGNTLVLGGLIQDDVRNGNTKVPFLGDIPWLGGLFRSDTKQRQKANLVVFVTPTIVTEEDYQPTTTSYLKTPVPTKDTIEEDWSAWDSGKPKDWSADKAPPSSVSTNATVVPSSPPFDDSLLKSKAATSNELPASPVVKDQAASATKASVPNKTRPVLFDDSLLTPKPAASVEIPAAVLEPGAAPANSVSATTPSQP
jgi:type II secretory pathway component GspD/PulD (secretin)